MTAISAQLATAAPQLPMALPPRELTSGNGLTAGKGGRSAEDVHEKFTQFVGETFFGQMLKSMRATVGKPAYFYGGHAEEVFRGQLDQKLAEEMTKSSAEKFAEPMFRHQFPHLAGEGLQNTSAAGNQQLAELNALRRR